MGKGRRLMSSTIGVALREIGSGQRVQVVARLRESAIMQFQRDEQSKPEATTGEQFFSLMAVSFRELGENSDVWEFRTMEMSPAGPVAMYVYLRGDDLFWVKRMAQVDVG